MIRFNYPSSLSPGGEQINRWSSEAAENQGSFNFAGARDPAIDAIIAALLAATTREDFIAAVRECRYCGASFAPRHAHQRYCTPAHQREQQKLRQREAKRVAIARWQQRVRELEREVAAARAEAGS